MVELATFESPYKRRTLGAETLENLGAWRAAVNLYLQQAQAAGITERYEQIIFALQKLEEHANLSVMLSPAFKDWVYSLGTNSARGYDTWRADYAKRQQAAEASRAQQAEAAASAASAQAAAYAEAMRKIEASREQQAQRAAIAASEQADAEAAAAIVDAEAAASAATLEKVVEAAQTGKATPEQVEQAAAVASVAATEKAKKDAVRVVVPLTIAAGLIILMFRKV